MPILRIALDTPLPQLFDYLCEEVVAPGSLVAVPFGRGDKIHVGVVLDRVDTSTQDLAKLKIVAQVIYDCPPLMASWRDLCQFASAYYHHPLGEVMVSSLPKNLRDANTAALTRAHQKNNASVTEAAKKLGAKNLAVKKLNASDTEISEIDTTLTLHPEQALAVAAINAAQGYTPFLLHGITGSGKTEVYLQAAAAVLARNQSAQVLILVPEINLTPQLLTRIEQRFHAHSVVCLHSGLSEGARLRSWLHAHSGGASIVLGTRLAIMASVPNLALIIVDEEHDASYKQQEGWHYSARDLAIWRAHQLAIPIVLGSATPSIETWYAAQNKRYQLLTLNQRAGDAKPPQIRCIDTGVHKTIDGLSQVLITAVRERLNAREQVLLFLNRRGYAPVLSCGLCAWVSECPNCNATLVLHTADKRLHCHLCAAQSPIPRACPTCGNPDIAALGRGTQRIEESLATQFATRADGSAITVLRIDADSVRKKGSAEEAFAKVHRGEIDILVGTQMVSKGHDFRGINLVAVLNADAALFSGDFRAGERLFAQLMQVAGRAGRASDTSEVLIQTRYPSHPLYDALIKQDYAAYATVLLEERSSAGLPPFSHQVILRAQARTMEAALEFLTYASELLSENPALVINSPIPMNVAKIANLCRAQLLIESNSRSQLQNALTPWVAALYQMKSRIRWQLEVDPHDV